MREEEEKEGGGRSSSNYGTYRYELWVWEEGEEDLEKRLALEIHARDDQEAKQKAQTIRDYQISLRNKVVRDRLTMVVSGNRYQIEIPFMPKR